MQPLPAMQPSAEPRLAPLASPGMLRFYREHGLVGVA